MTLLCLILLFTYPYILGSLVPAIVRPYLICGIPPELQKDAYLISIETITLSLNLKEIEIKISNLKIKNPPEYLTINKMTEPINCIDIDTIRLTFITKNLIEYYSKNFQGRLKIKEIFFHKIKINLLKYESISSLNILSMCGIVTKKR